MQSPAERIARVTYNPAGWGHWRQILGIDAEIDTLAADSRGKLKELFGY
jgi:hypothetical protein